MATHNGQNKGYGVPHVGIGTPDDTDEPTPPSAGLASLSEGSAPSWQAPPPTGTFAQPSFTPPPSRVSGGFTSPGFTPPIAPPSQVSGSYSSPGFIPPTAPTPTPFAQPSYTPAQPNQVSGNYSSPGFMPPSVTGTFAAPPVPGQYQNLTGQFSVDMLRQGPPQPGQPIASVRLPRGEPDTDMRTRYGIWGGVVGAMLGVTLGLLNAAIEGVPLERGLEPLMLMTIGMMIITSVICAWFPRVFEDLLYKFGLLTDD
jgi:hypothetical protein